MAFVESLLEEANYMKGEFNIESLWRKMGGAGQIVIWGTGLAGNMIYNALKQRGMEPDLFVDSDSVRQGKEIDGKKVVGPTEIPQKALVIIAANVRYRIHEMLDNRAIEYMYIDPVFLHFWNPQMDVSEILRENSKEIDTVYKCLSDNYSKKVFKNVLIHRMVHNINLIWDVYEPNQYFSNCTVKKAKGCFVDCGAYQGDTLKSFLNQIGDEPYEYYAFEAEKRNYEILSEYCKKNKLEKVHPLNLGVWDKAEELYFQSDNITGDVSGKIMSEQDRNVEKVMADSIDNILSEANIDFIKMDIEGAEIRALNGARESIRRSRPILTISAYHELEHLWQVPLLIKEINAGYKIFFNHHMWNMADTVCYAVEKNSVV
ncbi:MAG: FkbM family methyltransferase [Butyrivibrio sp.]|nr:FkbM family methyltransferase [Ruminococcus flavefaciens]MCM1560249.1 FkbM family methyltransferase [Butyrivibrio sp.]